MSGVIRTPGRRVAGRGRQTNDYNVNNLTGMHIGVVTDITDSLYTGRIKVRLSDFSSADADRIALLSTPYGGQTNILDSGDNEREYGAQSSSQNGSPKSYGMWPQPPAVGTNVVVLFTGSMEQGVVVGSLIAKDRNQMMGGNASSQVYTGEGEDDVALMPSSEKNPSDTNDPDTRPANPELTGAILEQGTGADFVRGHSMSSARRETPSQVFGITTQAGHTVSMDDGHSSGNSNNIRIRTRGGAQILIDDTHGFIHINNKSGSAWVEIDAAGRMDFYSEAGVSIHTEGDYNVHAKGSINMQAEQGVNIKSSGGEGVKIEASVGSIDTYSEVNTNMQSGTNFNILVAANYKLTATRVDINGPKAAPASKAVIQSQTMNSSVLTSITSRVPEHQPWLGNSTIQESFETGKGNV